MTEREVVSWDDVAGMCRQLSDRLRPAAIDAILGIARGGLVPTALLAQELCLRNVLVASVASYEGDRRGKVAFLQFPPPSELLGRRVLVVDDIWDTGRTLHAVRRRAEEHAATVTVAVLHYKPAASHLRHLSPDLWCRETAAWIVYPWERDL